MTNQLNESISPQEIFLRALALHEQGNLDQAEQFYRAALQADPNDIGSLHNFGILRFQQGKFEDAVALSAEILRRRPDLAAPHNTLAVSLRHLGRLEEAETCCRECLLLAPGYAEMHNTLGDVLTALGRFTEAETCCREALRLQPKYAEAHNNLGIVLASLSRPQEAEICYREALRLKPGNAVAFNNLSVVLLFLGRMEEAELCCREALRLEPGNAAALNNLGKVLSAQGKLREGAAEFARIAALEPGSAAALRNLGNALSLQGRLSEAAVAFGRAAALEPDDADALVTWLFTKQRMCDWSGHREDEARFRDALRAPALPSVAFRLLGISSTAEEQFAYACRVADKLSVPAAAKCPSASSRRGERLRLGYLFLPHPTGHLIAGPIEHHDRRRFEVVGYSAGPDDGSGVRTRLAEACDRFVDISEMQDLAVAQLIHADAIDILIDLIGFKPDGRPKIPAYRPAPIQVNYLGYPCTMGADFIDYIIVDQFVAPSDQQLFFSERLVHLPDCYQCNDGKRAIAEETPSRGECGLPEEGFVFCCFNDSYKLTPAFFDVWMRLLHAISGSVLWLLGANEWVRANLTREAAARGIAPARLIFAPWLPLPEHLARYRLADLFLDTLPCNAHTTASDALWAGLPVLTCAGNTFSGRVGGSLLRALGLGDLVTASLADYEALALRLAGDAESLSQLHARLMENRRTFPLFDTERSVRNLEAAYWRMAEIRSAGRPPAAFSVFPSAVTSASLVKAGTDTGRKDATAR
jgi:predicted O-linked N-acetylglucosamine transferase (SPINDLY family)